MDLLLALNVTIYGLGIVFLALLVLMVAIMLLTKAFSLATGKELLETATPNRTAGTPAAAATSAAAPVAAGQSVAEAIEAPVPSGVEAPVPSGVEAVSAPLPGKILSVAVKAGDRVKAGDELCVIEALKMGNSIKSPRDGSVLEVQVGVGDTVPFGGTLVLLASTGTVAARRPAPAAAPVAAPPVGREAAPARFALSVAGSRHSVDLTATDAVVVNGASYQVRPDPAGRGRYLVNGLPHSVEVQERTAAGAVVLVDGVAQRVEITPRPVAPSVAFILASAGTQHRVEVRTAEEGDGSVSVGGTSFEVKRDPAFRSRLLVNGKPHTVEIKQRTASGAEVWIDGLLQSVAIAAEAAGPPVAATAATRPAPAPPPAAPTAPGVSPGGAGERVTAPLPGKILSLAVKAGDRVKPGDELCVIEALKMGNSIKAQREGVVREVLVSPGQGVTFGAPLLILG